MTGPHDREERLAAIVTRWSRLHAHSGSGSRSGRVEWEYLFERYEPALSRYAFGLLRRWRPAEANYDRAREYVSEWFTAGLANRGLGTQLSEIRCFRAYVSTHLKRFILHELRSEAAAKRGGTAVHEHAGIEDLESREPDPAECQLDKGWLDAALAVALSELRATRPQDAEIIEDMLRHQDGGRTSSDLAARLGIPTAQLAVRRTRARQRLAVLLARTLRSTVASEQDLSDLLRHLKPYLPPE